MAKYAEGTSVSIAKSRAEIEKLLSKHKATGFMYGEQGGRAMIAFELGERRYRMELRYPSPDELVQGRRANQHGHTNYHRSPEQIESALEAEKLRLWRCLVLLVKAKLEAIASGISTIEDELLAYTVLPNNQTVGEWLEPQLHEVYASGQMPSMMSWVKQKQLPPGNVIEGKVIIG